MLELQYHTSQESEEQGLSEESIQPQEAKTQQKPFLSVKSVKEAVLEERRKQCYAIYGKLHEEKVQGGCQLMYKATYNRVVAALLNYNKVEVKDVFMRNTKSRYKLKTNFRSDYVLQKNLKKLR